MANCNGQVVGIAACMEEGWRAIFAVGSVLETESIACWLVVEDVVARHLHPVVPMGGALSDATKAGNYVGIVPPGITVQAWSLQSDVEPNSDCR